MDWTTPYYSKAVSSAGYYNYNPEQLGHRELPVSVADKATQTENLLYGSDLEDQLRFEDIDNEMEAEEHKVCVMANVVSQLELKENDEDKEFQIKNENMVASQDSCMPPGESSYQDTIRPIYIKEEVAPELNFMSPEYKMEYNFQNDKMYQPFVCYCPERQMCPYGVYDDLGTYNDWCIGRMQVDTEVQADSFECDVQIKCVKCGTVVKDRNSYGRCYLVPVCVCNACFEPSMTEPVVTSYLDSTARRNVAASAGTVPCKYCTKCFQTVRGMRIHMGHIHKGARPKH